MAQSRSEVMRETIETTYADLRPTDLVIDKSGQAWPLDAEIEQSLDGERVELWLCDPMSKIRIHRVVKPKGDIVKVSRIPTQADEAAKLEAEFPPSSAPALGGGTGVTMEEAVAAVEEIGGEVEAKAAAEKELHYFDPDPGSVKWCYICQKYHEDAAMADAVAAVEEIGGEVEAEVTAEEVDAANTATEEKPVSLPPFTDMDILQMRSHLYLLHGVYAHDMRSRQETIAMHDQAHADHDAGKLNSRHIPHAHTEVK